MVFRISGLVNDSIVDGPGLRYAVFTQGCPHNCDGCHNPQTHDPLGGQKCTAEEVVSNIRENPLLDGLTLTGGEPFIQAKELLPLAKTVKEMGLNVMAYSGFTFDELMEMEDARELLKYCDTLVDGRFVKDLRSIELRFKGSKNQRVIDVPASLEAGTVVEMNF